MVLEELLDGVAVREITGDASRPITGLHYDSRKIQPGDVFIAIRGEAADGHLFIPQALQRGAAGVVCESPVMAASNGETVWARVQNSRRALASASATFYAHPGRELNLVGITGTNGKTTTAFLIDSIFREAGKLSGLFGTVEYRLGDRRLPAPNTTPESLDLQAHLAELRSLGGTHAVLEVSSHALEMDRVYACPFGVAVFTNLTRDHLDFHGTMEAYFAAKRRLFTGLGTEPPEWAVLNADDPRSEELARCGSRNVLLYGFAGDAGVRPEEPAAPNSGNFRMRTPWGAWECRSALLGRPNVYNLLSAAAAALAAGFSIQDVERGLAALRSVPGRLERIDAGQPFLVLVDYAHTDDALRKLLETARELTRAGRVITLFGCGGDRDRAKRPLMGEAAGSLSDLVVLTSDNPRTEDPLAIIAQARVGVERAGGRLLVEPDRAAAIHAAVREARPGDIVLIAGKGHENYQVIGGEKAPFDDRVVAGEALRSLGYG